MTIIGVSCFLIVDSCFPSCSESVWRSRLRNAWPWRSSLIAPRPEMRLEESLLRLWLMPVVCCLWPYQYAPSAGLLSVFINSCFPFPRQSVSCASLSATLSSCGEQFVSRSLSMSLAAFCFDQAALTAVEQWDIESKQATQTSHERSHCWTVKAVTD